MGIKFVGGPYDGWEVEDAVLSRYATPLQVSGDLGQRLFLLMPPPENWDRLVRGESAERRPVYPYEQLSTPDGVHLEWPPSGALDEALSEAKLKVHPRGRTALTSLSAEQRRAIVAVLAELQKSAPEEWAKQQALRITDDKPVYLVPVPGAMRAFVRILDTGELELFDIVREETLRLFRQRYTKAAAPG